MQELGLSSYSSERDDAKGGAAKEGQQWHALFNTFYRLVFEHIASLVEVRLRIICLVSAACLVLPHGHVTSHPGLSISVY